MSLFQELKRRNVVQVGLAYAVVSWVVLQIIDVISPIFDLPIWAPKLVFVILVVGAVPALIFAWAFELTPEGLKKDADVDRAASIASTTGRKLNYVIFAALALAIVLLLVERQSVDRSADTADAKSIAVLPFVNMTSDPEQEYFSDGISEEILNSLAAVLELKVAGRTSSFAFKGRNEDLRAIGDALGVSHILEGSVRKSGDQVRITAQLIQADNGFHLWSETYDRKLVDVFAIQDEISAEILKQLKLRLLSDTLVVSDVDRTDPKAYELFLKARQRIYGRNGPDIEIAVKELDEVIAIDPDYAPAYAHRGVATLLLSETDYGSLPILEAKRRGKRFIDKALELNPGLAYGWAARGLYNGDDPTEVRQAIVALEKALEINPNLIDASLWLNNMMNRVGDMRGALEVIAELVERDPFYRPAFGNAIQQFNAFGQADKAEALLQRMARLDPGSPDIFRGRAVNYLFSGQVGKSLQVMEERNALGPMSTIERSFFTIGLIRTQQYQRAIDEGTVFQRVGPLYEMGRKDEAFVMADNYAAEGYPRDLFFLYLRENRHQDLIDYVEERWPGVRSFAEENVGDAFGYDTVSYLALAYKRAGDRQGLTESIAVLDEYFASVVEQGVNNIVLSQSLAFHSALKGELDAAFEHLQSAVQRGWSLPGMPTDLEPHYQLVADDPRYVAIEEALRATLNRDRAIVGLAPVDANYEATGQ